MADYFKALPFWELNPNYTAMTLDQPDLVWTALAHPDRSVVVLYACTRTTGQTVAGASVQVRLPDGNYRINFQNPADMTILGTYDHPSGGLGKVDRIPLPQFKDDVIVTVQRVKNFGRTRIPGTQ